MKNEALDIHKKLYKSLTHNSNTNKYANYLKSELGVLSIDNCLFSTAEHLAPFNTINTISFLLPQLLLQHFNMVEKKDIVILGGSLISLDNIDYPRGFYRIGQKKRAFNLFSQKQKKTTVLSNNKLTYEDIQDKSRENFFQEFTFLKKEFQQYHKSFAHQQCSIMKTVVKKWSFDSGQVIIEPLEYIAKNILIRLLEENDTSINILFKNLELFKKDTYNIFCGWNETKGTFLFWEVEDKQLNRIVYSHREFIGKNIKFRVDFGEILTLLKKDKILPSVSLSLFIVSWLPNIPIAGGHRQYWYWQYMITSFDNIFKVKSKKELSQFGYNQLSFLELDTLSHYGTGLDLAINHMDKNRLFNDVFNLSIYKSNKRDGFYEC